MSADQERPAGLSDIQGVWRRDARALDGGGWDEVTDVMWLQAGLHFCDVRVARHHETGSSHVLDRTQAFSGVVVIDAGDITFHHDLDSLARDPAHPDQGTVHRRGDQLIERGPGFEERWITTPPAPGVSLVADYRPPDDIGGPGPLAARLVRVGSTVLVVWGGSSAGGAIYDLNADRVPVRCAHCVQVPVHYEDAVWALHDDDPLPRWWSVTSSEGAT